MVYETSRKVSPRISKIRSKNKNFIKLCLNSDLSSEITLQPLKRYDLDAAIIFSDILIVPYALGQDVRFTKGLGPVLSNFNIRNFNSFNNLEELQKKLRPVYDSIKKVRKKLDANKTLISFVGAPWTLLTYMFGLKKKDEKLNIEKFLKEKKIINNVLESLTEYLCLHINNQIKAGANIVQIFDSWAGLLQYDDFHTFCIEPNKKIVNFCKKKKKIPVICFPKGIGKKYSIFNNLVKPDGINLDYDINPIWARQNLGDVVFQGGMHPRILLKSENLIQKEAKKYLDIFKDVPYIFNLGHGLVPETDPMKLKKLIEFVKRYK